MTNYIGELLQHDSSHHLWAPLINEKWYLITTLDDYSRYLLYADLWERETSWVHIVAAESVVMRFGCPLKYYTDRHSIFKYIEKRDGVHNKGHTPEEKTAVQWKMVLNDINTEAINALSPQAKGKIERPYRWLQDRVVRTCLRDGVKNIGQAREILKYEVEQYNHVRVHSTTHEVPAIRFNRAIQNGQSLFRKFEIKKPFQSIEDIFCLRTYRVVDSYRKISINNLQLYVSGIPTLQKVELRIRPDLKANMAIIKIWFKGQMVGQHQVKLSDLNIPSVLF